jgi:hypothetical protein
MRALTIWQPWASAIVAGPKWLENRTWKPPAWIAGKRIAIHAGKVLDREASEDLRLGNILSPGMLWPHDPAALPRGAIIGTARVTGYVTDSTDPWFVGPVGWVLADVEPCEPVPCRGAQGIWVVPAEVLAQMGRAA